MENQQPAYNLKAVLRETGLKADTLRAWERRYGLPEPQRSSGGHRLFSQRDIDTLKWLMARQEQGLSISRAVGMWRGLEGEGQDPLQAMPIGHPPATLPHTAGAAIDELLHAWIDACVSFDDGFADQLLTQAFAQFPPESVILEVLVKGLSEVGEGWYRGELSVQQEHHASALAVRRVEALLTAVPAATHPGAILVLCPPGEEHTFSPLILTYLLRRRGHRVIFLGANVPIQRFKDTLDSVKPLLILMIAQELRTASAMLSFGSLLETQRIPLAFGGRVFTRVPNIQQAVPGYFLGDSLAGAADAVEQLIARTPPALPVNPISSEYLLASKAFTLNHDALIGHLGGMLGSEGVDFDHLVEANRYLTSDVIAALHLGDIQFLAPSLEWVGGLLNHRGLPAGSLERYIQMYQSVVEEVLGHDGKLVVDYLEQWGTLAA